MHIPDSSQDKSEQGGSGGQTKELISLCLLILTELNQAICVCIQSIFIFFAPLHMTTTALYIDAKSDPFLQSKM